MTWGFIWLMVVLKIPIGMLLYLVWWAVHQETDPEQEGAGGDGGTKVRPPHDPRAGRGRFPRRRGPHGDPTPPAPARVRTTVARAREPERDSAGARARPRPGAWEDARHAQQPASVLSDGTIRRLVAEGRIRIEPWDPLMVQPASVDLKLGSSFRVFHNHRIQVDRPRRSADRA